MTDEKHFSELVERLANHRVLVVGDLMIDEYLVGRAVRLSREAPVPVLEQTHSFAVLGGAGNPARNISALGSQAVVAGVVGGDEAAVQLRALLHDAGIGDGGLVADPDRPTTTKTRLVAESALRVPQHLARIDRLLRQPLGSAVEEALLQQLELLAPQCDAILVSHYRNGVATPAVVDRVRQLARQHSLLAVADAQANLGRFAGFDLVKCNRAEAEGELGQALASDADFERALVRLVARLGVANLAITRGADGLSALSRGQVVIHSPAVSVSDIYDVVGAGDTVVSVLTLALAGGVSLRSAAYLGNVAGGLVVRRLGNAVVTGAELTQAVLEPSPG